MFKKSNVLPFVLALASTLLVLGLGYEILKKITVPKVAEKNTNSEQENVTINSTDASSLATSEVAFSEPGIVPMGISVKINGSEQMTMINQSLKKSFQQEFPGTTVNFEVDGNETAIRLLLSGQVDLAALNRPLNNEEQAQGLKQVIIDADNLNKFPDSSLKSLFYAYRTPANIKVEAFLGHLLSAQGQEAIVNP